MAGGLPVGLYLGARFQYCLTEKLILGMMIYVSSFCDLTFCMFNKRNKAGHGDEPVRL